MQHTLVCVGTLKAQQEADLYKRYAGRLRKAPKLIEIPDKNNKEQEGQAIIKVLPKDCFIFALDEKGQAFTSLELARFLEQQALAGKGRFCWIIGGADGLHAPVKTKADVILSLSRLTWPHQLARLLLVEQLYRLQTIMKDHPYHRS